MYVIRNRNIFFLISGIIITICIAALAFWGLDVGIDFTGGSIIEVTYTEEVPSTQAVQNRLNALDLGGGVSVRPTEESGFFIRTPFLDAQGHESTLDALSFEGEFEVRENRFSSVGPAIGQELRTKAIWGIGLVILAIILFITFAFRKVSEPVSSWKYGVISIIALVHDILVPVGVFAVIGEFGTAEVDVLFVMALLAILGYSVNDTIVVFDRVRENLKLNEETKTREPFGETVGRSLNQTYARSLNTSVTTGLVLLALYFFGGASTELFALTLLVGVIAGSYSSLFLASPLLVSFAPREEK